MIVNSKVVRIISEMENKSYDYHTDTCTPTSMTSANGWWFLLCIKLTPALWLYMKRKLGPNEVLPSVVNESDS